MKYSELQPALQNLTNRKISITEIGNILGESRQTMHKRVSGAKGDIPQDEIVLLEKALNIEIPQDMLVDEITVDFYPDVFGSCGNGVFVLSEERQHITVPKSAFFTRFSPSKTYSVITARGNSMEPLFFEKDKLIIEHWDGEQIVDNCPYIFCYGNEIFIKRLAKNIDQLMIIPENKDYDIRKLSGKELDKILIIGQIVGLMRDLR